MNKKRTIFFESLLGKQWTPETVPVDGINIPAADGLANIEDLHYWVDNPRVYDEVHSIGLPSEEITTDQIFKKLSTHHDCISLKKKIFSDGGQRKRIIVAKDITGKTNNFVVYEGNTRLASFTSLFKDGAKGEWDRIKVTLLDLDGLDPELVITYVGDIHLEDEINRWATHKGARYYHRLVKSELEKGQTENQSFAKVAAKFSGKITPGVVKKNYKVIDFMEQKKMGVTKQGEQFSYWIEYFQNSKNQNVRKFFNDPKNLEGKVKEPKKDAYDDMMVEKVSKGKITGEVERVSAGGNHSFRKDISNISSYFYTQPRQAKSLIYKLIDGDIRLDEAAKIAVEGGASDRDYRMIKDFHSKLFSSDPRKLRKAVKKYDDLLDMVKEIQNQLKLTHMDLRKEYQRIKNKNNK
jgi:hypothetical protein